MEDKRKAKGNGERMERKRKENDKETGSQAKEKGECDHGWHGMMVRYIPQ